MSVLLVAAKRELVENKVSLLTDAGLIPEVIDVDAFALHNAFEVNHPDAHARDGGGAEHRPRGHEHQHPRGRRAGPDAGSGDRDAAVPRGSAARARDRRPRTPTSSCRRSSARRARPVRREPRRGDGGRASSGRRRSSRRPSRERGGDGEDLHVGRRLADPRASRGAGATGCGCPWSGRIPSRTSRSARACSTPLAVDEVGAAADAAGRPGASGRVAGTAESSVIEINLLPGAKRKRGGKGAGFALPDVTALAGSVKDPWLIACHREPGLLVLGLGTPLYLRARPACATLEPRLEAARARAACSWPHIIRKKTSSSSARLAASAEIDVIRDIDRDRYVWPHSSTRSPGRCRSTPGSTTWPRARARATRPAAPSFPITGKTVGLQAVHALPAQPRGVAVHRRRPAGHDGDGDRSGPGRDEFRDQCALPGAFAVRC